MLLIDVNVETGRMVLVDSIISACLCTSNLFQDVLVLLMVSVISLCRFARKIVSGVPDGSVLLAPGYAAHRQRGNRKSALSSLRTWRPL